MIAPFTYFGGKRRIAELVWQRFGPVNNFVEPFAGSLAVLLGRPKYGSIETVNDLNGWITNFWRAVKMAPDLVAKHCDRPVNEIDMHAIHEYLGQRLDDLEGRLRHDPYFFDAEFAGWWVWGQCCWIGDDWASPQSKAKNGKLPATHRKGVGARPHLGRGSGINSVERRTDLDKIMQDLAARLRFTRICCGDWTRVCSYSTLDFHGLTAIFFDPPYAVKNRADCYMKESRTVAIDVAKWCRENENNPKLRIALCGYEGEHDMPGWDCVAWSADGGYGNKSGNQNRHLERIWFSPHCLKPVTEPKAQFLF